MVQHLFLCVLLCILGFQVKGHPQCLDSLAPFRRKNHVCRDYRAGRESCCYFADEKRIRLDAKKATANYCSSNQRKACRFMLKRVLCTECSPWANHIYDGTPETSNGRQFPSLCHGYCRQFYNICYDIIFDFFGLNSTGYSNTLPDSSRFCKAHSPTYPWYCYPGIINGPTFPPNVEDTSTSSDCLCGTVVASGLKNPLAAIPPGDGSGTLFIVEQRGTVRVLTKKNKLLDLPFLNIASKVLTSSRKGDERGLLGLAFHPNYTENRRFFVYYSSRDRPPGGGRSSHVSKISEFRVLTGNANRANATSERVILTVDQPEGNHNGGQIFFHEGYLYIATGDGGGAGDRHGRIGNSLDTSNLLGCILRIDVSNESVPYEIPEDNPFVNNSAVRPEIFAYGLRNPWRCSVDRGDENGNGRGRIFCGDVGQNRYEEIDIIEKGGNYGWRAFEGNACYNTQQCLQYS